MLVIHRITRNPEHLTEVCRDAAVAPGNGTSRVPSNTITAFSGAGRGLGNVLTGQPVADDGPDGGSLRGYVGPFVQVGVFSRGRR